MLKNTAIYHIIALTSIAIWGTTFISTKLLLAAGLAPSDIFFYRFLLAYTVLLTFVHNRLFARSWKDELILAGCGICGGSLYFITENSALQITLASNVSLIICTSPLFTSILSHAFIKGERMGKNLIIGSIIALAGVALVVFNGSFILELNPLGDLLTIAAALTWGFYNILLRKIDNRYSTLFITRKVFFYGILTILPVFCFSPLQTSPSILFTPTVIGNMLFLGFIASLCCYTLFNMAVKHLGSVTTNNYLYITPIVTLITSAIILDEPITSIAILGTVLILGGVCFAERYKHKKKPR